MSKDGTTDRHQGHLKLFVATVPLASVAVDIAGPFQRSSQGIPFVVGNKDHYSKLARDIPTANEATPHVALVFLDHWAVPHGISDYL